MLRRGFTLIELLVVIAVMGAVMALVGPLGLAQLERSERISEFKRLEQLVKDLSQKSFLSGSGYVLKLDGQVIHLTSLAEQKSKDLNFKHLFFPAQQIEVYNTGFYSADAVSVVSRGNTSNILLNTEVNDDPKR